MPIFRSPFGVFIPAPDSDADSYIARVGVTDFQAKIDIHNFVKELKNRGLFTLLTSIYLGRSRHNAGAGSTLHDLKNVYDLTATGSPTFSDMGMFYGSAGNDFHGSASITTAVGLTLIQVGVCARPVIIADNQRVLTQATSTGAENYFQVNIGSSTPTVSIFYTRNATNFFPTSAASTNRITAYQSSQFSMGATVHRQMINGTLVSTTLATSRNPIGTATFKLGSSSGFVGYLAYANLGTQELTLTQLSDLEMCYNNFIMTGLMR